MSLQTELAKLKSRIDAHEAILGTGTDPDSIINKWTEVVAVLNGISESSTIVSLLSGYVSKASDLVDVLTSTATDKAATANTVYQLKGITDTIYSEIAARVNTTFITGNAVLTSFNRHVYATITTASQTLSMASNPYTGLNVEITLSELSSQALSISGNGKTINGSATYSLSKITFDSVDYPATIRLRYNGTEWKLS